NADLVVAAARVDEARAVLGEANSFFWPTVDAQAGASRSRLSQSTATSFPGFPNKFNDYRATLNVSYEIDVFGRLRAGADAARAELQASEASREAVRIALAAQVAKSYYAMQALDQEVALTRETVRLREEALELQKKRYRGGVLSEFELRQLEAETASVRAQLPPLEQARETEEAALSVLLGRTPREVMESTVKVAQGEVKLNAPVLPEGMPSELLLRRPDLVNAERQLAASHAQIAVARAEMFPSIALTGYLGRESAQLDNLFLGPAGIANIALGLTQPIFAGGRLQARTQQAEARERQALAQYQQAIRNAFGEVRSALAVQARSRESFDAQSVREQALAETARLAHLRYDNGVASQLDVIDAERNLLAARVARIDALRQHRAAIADLFRALGG
ncbi:MAG TPA: efflux transporter outer membrane subunit, partial [Burkholderiales bacterium]|nr:efflux transporter outer membrane subunit [Burkholderiales bacterium]